MSSQNYSQMQEQASYIDRILSTYPLSQSHKTMIIKKAGTIANAALESLAETLHSIDKAGKVETQVNRSSPYGIRFPSHTQGTKRGNRGANSWAI